MAVSSTQIASTKFALELDGVRVGFLAWAEGGEAVGDVVEVSLGGGNMQKKHVGNVRWAPIRIAFGIAMGQPLYDWIKAFLALQAARKDGAVIAFGANGKARWRLDWRNGQIVEVCFPGGDGADRAEGLITLTIQPQSTLLREDKQGPALGAALKPKRWVRGNFRVALDNIPGDTRRILRTGDVVVRRTITEYRDGASRFPSIILGPQKISDWLLTLPEGQAGEFAAWAEDFLVQGHSSDADERNGSFEYLDPAMRPLLTLGFKHLGIYRLARERDAADKSGLARMKACLYCEALTLDRPASIKSATVKSAAKPRRRKAVAKRKARKATGR